MGETKKAALRVDFDRSLKLEFHGSKLRATRPKSTPWDVLQTANKGERRVENADGLNYTASISLAPVADGSIWVISVWRRLMRSRLRDRQ